MAQDLKHTAYISGFQACPMATISLGAFRKPETSKYRKTVMCEGWESTRLTKASGRGRNQGELGVIPCGTRQARIQLEGGSGELPSEDEMQQVRGVL